MMADEIVAIILVVGLYAFLIITPLGLLIGWIIDLIGLDSDKYYRILFALILVSAGFIMVGIIWIATQY